VGVLNAPSLSIVGTRRPTIYGTQLAERMGKDLAKRGLVIVSGMARGVDALSHDGATSVGGRAIGVLGTGIDVCYPKENKKLFEKVLERGAVISELPIGSPPVPENFPVRNRIIAGMPLGVVIVEGKQYSGSLITARLAMEFGREVFGVPGNITQETSFAPNLLIKQGAKLVTSAEDVIEELPTPIRAALVQAEAIESEQRNLLAADGLSPEEKRIYELLSAEEPRQIDDIVETTGLNSSEVLATLFNLEMKGIIRQLPGKQFTKVLL
jgi:DNA processing protein